MPTWNKIKKVFIDDGMWFFNLCVTIISLLWIYSDIESFFMFYIVSVVIMSMFHGIIICTTNKNNRGMLVDINLSFMTYTPLANIIWAVAVVVSIVLSFFIKPIKEPHRTIYRKPQRN